MILAAAGTLIARAKSATDEGATPDDADRLSRLEQRSNDLAAEVHALTAAQARTAKRAQVALVLAIVAAALAASACVILLLS